SHFIAPSVLAALLALAAPALSQPRFEASDGGIFLRFLDRAAPDEPRSKPPVLALSFGGDPVHAVMDTGSTGIVVSAATIP
ncbi:hypothetical protein NL449_29040, partial [Klebsiella pneumoniae]|nr:hypothetical protein [Klebsiella pneumoniae]